MQVIELDDRSAVREKVCFQMSRHNFLQHVCEQIVSARTQCLNSRTEAFELWKRELSQRRHCQINQRDSDVRGQILNLRPDLLRLVPGRFGFDTGEIVELLLSRF